jgi:predicted nuclease of predicted toxin-antitoxin system
MRFLLDVNASGAVLRWLMAHGHDVREVGSKDTKMTDEEIINWAVDEQRIIITTDTDFEEMIWRQGRLHCGVLRLENLPRTERIMLLQDALNQYGNDLEQGCVIIAKSKKFRIRRLQPPTKDSC